MGKIEKQVLPGTVLKNQNSGKKETWFSQGSWKMFPVLSQKKTDKDMIPQRKY